VLLLNALGAAPQFQVFPLELELFDGGQLRSIVT
jgi:hypothetical protein